MDAASQKQFSFVGNAALPADLPHTLKLFAAEPRLGPQASLRACFEAYVLPELDERATSTLIEYETTLCHWERLAGDPPVGSIDRAVLKMFRTKLFETKYRRGNGPKRSRSPATVNKVFRTLKAMITPLWPADRHNPGGRGLVPFCKFPEPLATCKSLPFVYSRKDLTALYLAAEACATPKQQRMSPLHNPSVWRAAMVLALNTGPRTWDLFSLKWSDVRWDDFRFGSVFFAARKTAKVQRPPLNRCASTHLKHLQSLALDSERVFPGFAKGKAFYDAWGRICAKAGVPDADFEDFRKTCSTLHDDIFPGVGPWLTGHEVRGVNAQNYQNPTKRVLRTVYSLKLPRGFRLGMESILATLNDVAG